VITTAVQFSAPRTVELVDLELPPLRDGHALVRTLYSGISGGTEMLAYRGEIDPSLPLDETLGQLQGQFSWPFRYGYSLVGEVAESRCPLRPGTSVFCYHPHQGHIVAKATELIKVGACTPRLATLFPLVETALQISLDAGPLLHEPVVVLGLGVVGILTGALLTRSGAAVIGSDPLEWRRHAADSLGVMAVDPTDLEEHISVMTRGRGVSLVIDAAGSSTALAGALDLLTHEGTVLVASWYGTKPVTLPLGGSFHRRRLTLRSTQVSSIPGHLAPRWTLQRRRETTLELMKDLTLEQLATHSFPVNEVAAAFEAVDSKADELIHAALSYGEG
jgi:2-desacetyl-2-hydroxyethyl bacteriochlorophyllide A dehydrogenase